jgi:hypothetical protein
LIRSAGWLYSGLVAVTSRTAEAEVSSPSFDVIDIEAIVFLQKVDGFFFTNSNFIRRGAGITLAKQFDPNPLSPYPCCQLHTIHHVSLTL